MSNTNFENQNTSGKFSTKQVEYVRNFLTIFQVIFTCGILPHEIESLLWVHFVLTIQLLQSQEANFRNASIHYLTGFSILILSKLTFEQKVLDIILSLTPYFYYETVLQHATQILNSQILNSLNIKLKSYLIQIVSPSWNYQFCQHLTNN